MEIYKNKKELPKQIDGLDIYPIKLINYDNFYGLHIVIEENGNGVEYAIPLEKAFKCHGFVQYVYEAKPKMYYGDMQEKVDFEFELRGMSRGFMDEEGCFHYTYYPGRKMMYPTGAAFLPM